MNKVSVATKAFVIFEGKVLILRESSEYEEGENIGKYDVAGGRIKQDLGFDENLVREVKEETGIDIRIGRPFFVKEWRAGGERIMGVFFKCFSDSDQVVLSKDHDDFKWIDPKEYKNYEIIDDLSSVFEAFLNLKP